MIRREVGRRKEGCEALVARRWGVGRGEAGGSGGGRVRLGRILEMEQQTGSKQEKEYIKVVYCHPAYLTYMQSEMK